MAVTNGADREHVRRALSGFNRGVTTGVISDTTVNGANTFAVLRARVVANIDAETNTEENQAGKVLVLRALDAGNVLGTLTDARLSGLTTVAGVRALFVADDPSLDANYSAANLE